MQKTSDQDSLQPAVVDINSFLVPEGLCPALLVFDAIPRQVRRTTAPSQRERACLNDMLITEVEREQSRRKTSTLSSKGGLKDKETPGALRKPPAEVPVFVYRHYGKVWQGPSKFVPIEGETVPIRIRRGRKIFSNACQKPLVKSTETSTERERWAKRSLTAYALRFGLT